MEKFVPKEKMSKKLRKKLDAQRRTLWTVNPVTKKTESANCITAKKDPGSSMTTSIPGSF